MELGKEYFGPLWKYIANEEITDVDYNGREIWLTNIYNERYRVNQAYVDENMTLAFVEQFTQRIANVVSQQFNKQNPELEAETSELRVTVLHESIARSGRSISIRKTPPVIRLTAEKALQEQYCSRDILAVLVNCVLTKMNLIFCGMPGIGKTECVKFFPSMFREMSVSSQSKIPWRSGIPQRIRGKTVLRCGSMTGLIMRMRSRQACG